MNYGQYGRNKQQPYGNAGQFPRGIPPGTGFKTGLGVKDAMNRITLEEIRDFCDIDWDEKGEDGVLVHSEEEKNARRDALIRKLQRCKAFLESDPLGQKVAKYFGTIVNASTDSSIGTPPDLKLTKRDYALAEQYGIDPEEAYVMRMTNRKAGMQKTTQSADIAIRKGLGYTAEGLYMVTDPKGFAKDTLNNIPPPMDDVPLCPYCGEPSTYIERYNRYYCHSCRKYLPKNTSPNNAPNSGIPAPPPSDGTDLV